MSVGQSPSDGSPKRELAGRIPILRWSRFLRLLIMGTLTSLTATAIVGYMGVIGVLPAVQRYMEDLPVTQHVLDAVQNMRVERMQPGYLNILVADLEGDDRDGRNSAHVLNSLVGQFGASELPSPVRVQRAYRILHLPVAPDTATATERLVEKGREQLNRFNGDILVWGEVARGDANKMVLRLRFLQRTASQTSLTGNYTLDQTLELPEKFGNDLGAALAAQVAADAAPAYESGQRHVAPLLKSVYDRLRALTKNMPKALTASQRGSILSAFAKVSATIGDQSNDIGRINEAVQAYRAALQEWTRLRDPQDWARTQVSLGAALTLQGWREDSAARFEDSVRSYRLALEVYDRVTQPSQWAHAQNGICAALRRLGDKTNQAATLEQAVTACRSALEVYNPVTQRLGWVAANGNLAAALSLLGEFKNSTSTLQEALTAFKDTLKAVDRRREPLNWARATHDVGWTLTRIGQIEKDKAILAEAIADFQAAALELPRDKFPKYWNTVQSNHAYALLALGRLEYREDAVSAARRFAEASQLYEELAIESEREDRALTGAPGAKTARAFADLALAAISTREFDRACKAAERGVQLLPQDSVIQTKKALCLMFTGKTGEAKTILLSQLGKTNARGSGQATALKDFAFLRDIGLEDPLMAEVEAASDHGDAQGQQQETDAREER